MVKTYQNLNPSFAKVEIDPRKKTARFTYVAKESTFRMLWMGLSSIFHILYFIPLIVFTIIVCWHLGSTTTYDDVVMRENSTCVYNSTNNAILLDYEFDNDIWDYLPIMIALAMFIISPLILVLIFYYNKTLLKAYPDLCVKFSNMGGYNYVKVTKMKSKVYEVPYFENMMLDFTVTGDFKKYLLHYSTSNYDFKYKNMNIFKKFRKSEDSIEYWKAKFEFSRIPKSGYLEIHFI